MKSDDWRKARRNRALHARRISMATYLSQTEIEEYLDKFEDDHEELVNLMRYGAEGYDDDV